MNRVFDIVLWSFGPGFQSWRIARQRGITRWPVLRVTLIYSLPRTIIVMAVVWSILSGNWFAAAVFAMTLLALGLLSESVTKWMIKRWGGSNEPQEKQ